MYGCFLLDKVQSIESIKKYFMSADKKYFHLRSRLTKVLGSYYYKPMVGEELEAAIEKAYI
jgi:two-component SAPR family response regulator